MVRAVMAEWQRTDLGYEDRINNMINGGGLNGSFKLNRTTVLDDGVKDKAKGENGRDWFLVGFNDKTDDEDDEIVTII